MKIFIRTLSRLLHTFGGVILFQVIFWRLGLKAAIAATLVFLLADGAWRLAQRERLPMIWLLANGLTLVFGVIDLWAKTPFMIRFEAPITNSIAGLAFLLGARGDRPIILEFAEQWQGAGNRIPLEKPGMIAFFRAFTLAWAIFFFARAAVFLWLAFSVSLDRAIVLRSMIDPVSFIAMMAISICGRPIFGLCQSIGLLPKESSGSPAP
ncbi:MAG: septation protein IspZ [Rhizomicrobium sp.]